MKLPGPVPVAAHPQAWPAPSLPQLQGRCARRSPRAPGLRACGCQCALHSQPQREGRRDAPCAWSRSRCASSQRAQGLQGEVEGSRAAGPLQPGQARYSVSPGQGGQRAARVAWAPLTMVCQSPGCDIPAQKGALPWALQGSSCSSWREDPSKEQPTAVLLGGDTAGQEPVQARREPREVRGDPALCPEPVQHLPCREEDELTQIPHGGPGSAALGMARWSLPEEQSAEKTGTLRCGSLVILWPQQTGGAWLKSSPLSHQLPGIPP